MPKRKPVVDSDAEDDEEQHVEEKQKKTIKKPKVESPEPKAKAVKKPKVESDAEEEAPKEKKPKSTKAKSKAKVASEEPESDSETPGSVPVLTNADGEKYLDLGRKRRVTVRKFKGTALLDIREYYGKDENDLKPGSKGISLKLEEWEALKNSSSAIDKLFAKIK